MVAMIKSVEDDEVGRYGEKMAPNDYRVNCQNRIDIAVVMSAW
jgi:hypothetical protein